MSGTAPETLEDKPVTRKDVVIGAAILTAIICALGVLGYIFIPMLINTIDQQAKFEAAFTTTYDVERTTTTRNEFSVFPHHGARLICTQPIMAHIEAKQPITCTSTTDGSVVTLEAKH